MKYYIVAGEASGDLLGAHLLKEVKKLDTAADFRGWGGDLLEKEGMELIKHYKELAFMGFWEVLKNLRTILNNLNACKVDILLYEPDVLILIDYPGFNLRIAEFAKEKGIRVVYYVSPTVWAWKKSRVYNIKRDVDTLLTILPFEAPFYEKYQYKAHYIGHPLLDVITPEVKASFVVDDFRQKYQLNNKPIVALLPGSRRQEIVKILPVMARVMKNFPNYQFVISKVPWLDKSLYYNYLPKDGYTLVEGETYHILQSAETALVASGTATLETAILNIPQVVCYKTSAFSYFIGRLLVGKTLKYISLVNLIMDQPIVKELLQHDCTEKTVTKELQALLKDSTHKNTLLQGYQALIEELGNSGASARAAQLVVNHKQ